MAVRKTKKGLALKRWFKEKWKDEKGNPCGSSKNKKLKFVGRQEELIVNRLKPGVK